MNNHAYHDSYWNAYSPNYGCKFSASFLLLSLVAAFNFWWFLLDDHDLHLIHNSSDHDTVNVVAVPPPPPPPFCNSRSRESQSCDIFNGKWVRDPRPPLYTNDTCKYIFPNQDCMTNGRPDRDFIHWKWKPHDCDIPDFDPAAFLHLMTGKKMVFVGDSLARNQMQSLVCSIAQVDTPEDAVPELPGMQYAWRFPSYNFTLALAWSPFLVNYTVEEGLWKIHVDRLDWAWTSAIDGFDVAVFNTLYWFFRPSIYYAKGERISEQNPANTTSREPLDSMKRVWRTVLKYVVENYSGVAVLRTVSISHFDGNPWDKGGTCYKTQPVFDTYRNMSLPWVSNEMLKLQKDAFMEAVEFASSRKSESTLRLRLLDVAYNTFLRPDGHPGAHRIQTSYEPRNDCTHWCMPGAIDTWNRLLFADPEIMCS